MQMKRVPDLKHMLVQVDEYNYLNNTLSQTERKTTLCINSVPTQTLYSNWDLKFGLSLLLIEDAFKYSSV